MAMVPDKNAANNFYGQLNAQANQVVGSTFGAKVVPVEFSKQGDFPWFFSDPATNNFNLGTFNYISQRVGPSQNIANGVQLIDSFPNLYNQIITGISYTLSDADNQQLSQATTNAASQGQQLVSIYQQTFGPITQAQKDAANKLSPGIADTNLGYVISYVIGYQWSGQQAAGKMPLSWKTMQGARSLEDLLVNMPPQGQIVLNPLTTYLNILGPGVQLSDMLGLGSNTLAQLRANSSQPTTVNGGITTIDANGNVATNVGYSLPNQTTSKILNDLQNKGRKISMTMTATQSSSSTWNVSVNTQAGFTLSGDFITVNGSMSTQYNMLTMAGAGTSVSVSMDYTGYSMVNVGSTDWNQANNTGWFDALPISQAVKNGSVSTAKGVTGYKWASNTAPTTNFAQDGNFGVLQGLLISNYPTITITYHTGNYNQFKQSFATQSHASVSLFGFITIGSVDASTYSAQMSSQNQDGSFSVTLAPSDQTLSVPPLQQTAYVIGAAIGYPVAAATTTSAAAEREVAATSDPV